MKNYHYILFNCTYIAWYKEFKTKSNAMNFMMIVRTFVYEKTKNLKIIYCKKLPKLEKNIVKFPLYEYKHMIECLKKGLK